MLQPLTGGNITAQPVAPKIMDDTRLENHATDQPDLTLSGNIDTIPSSKITTPISPLRTNSSMDDIALLNPVTLKTVCIQKLSGSITHRKPMSLMEICINYMSWKDDHRYPCCMQLPTTMNTMRHMLELQRIRISPVPHSSTKEVVLYDHVKVNSKVKDIWIIGTQTQKLILEKTSIHIQTLKTLAVQTMKLH